MIGYPIFWMISERLGTETKNDHSDDLVSLRDASPAFFA